MGNKVHYIYRHIRLDNNEPFYIGKGCYSKNKKYSTFRSQYRRSFEKAKRTDSWKKITKSSKYRVEILYEHEDESFIFEKEREFIALYGRLHLKKGSLVNHTPGGDGCSGENNGMFGRSHSEESRKKMSESSKGKNSPTYGKPRSKEFKEKVAKALGKVIYQFDKEGNFINEYFSLSEALKHMGGSSHNSIIQSCRKKNRTAFGYIWRYKDDIKNINKEGNNIKKYWRANSLKPNNGKTVQQFDINGKLIAEYNSITTAAKENEFDISYISKACRNKVNEAYGFIWKFK